MTNSISKLVDNASIRQLQNLQVDGVISAKSLTTYYIDRIKESSETINAVITVNPHSVQEAERLECCGWPDS